MCGICCIISLRSQRDVGNVTVCNVGRVERTELYETLRRRGPDAFGSLHFDLCPAASVEAASAVLFMRGSVRSECSNANSGTASQPAVVPSNGDMAKNGGVCCLDDSSSPRSFFLWNGEVFGGALHVPSHTSDTTALLSRFNQLEFECATGLPDSSDKCFAESLLAAQELFSRSCVRMLEDEVEGPYAFVYYAKSLMLFLFGRDPLGRRSLLMHVSITSLGEREERDSGDGTLRGGMALEVVISSVAGRHFNTSFQKGVSAENSNKRSRCESCNYNSGGGGYNNDATHLSGLSCSSASSLCCCWKEVSNSGVFAISVAPCLKSPLMFHSSWAVTHSIHPLLRFRYRQEQQTRENELIIEEKKNMGDEQCSVVLERLLQHSDTCSFSLLKSPTHFDIEMAKRYLKTLWRAIEVRVKAENCGGDPVRPVGVLFSGGIDCTVLAAVAHHVLPLTTPIELINVAFGHEPELAPDRLATFRAFEQLLQLPKFWKDDGNQEFHVIDREWRLVLVDVPFGGNMPYIQNLLHPGNSVIDMSIGTALWHAAQGHGRMQRVFASEEVASGLSSRALLRNRHRLYRVSGNNNNEGSFVSQEVLFTGSKSKSEEDKFAPLVNAIISEVEAFGEAPSSPVLLSTLGKDYATALRPVLSSYGYKKLGSYVDDAFSAGVIAFARPNEAPSKAIRLVRPVDLAKVQTVTPARWLTCDDQSTPLGLCVENYKSEARVLLLGMGADETLGGYTRYRRAFERRGAEGLADELDRDFGRLWKRNLGRDDRVVCDSGKEGRYPYLDEEVLATLAGIAAEAHQRATANSADVDAAVDVVLQQALAPVCCFTAEEGPPGVGDKKILRHCAAMLGLGDVARLQKRAIQFGSRVAHVPSRPTAQKA